MNDLADVDALLARVYPRLLKPDYPPSVLVTALPIISRANPALLSSGTYHVAVTELDALVGAGGWTRDRSDAELGHIRHVVTDDRLLRRGIGRAVVAHSLNEAREAGMVRMECWSTRTAEPFYAALGFVTRGPMEIELRPGIAFPALRMQLQFSA
ncbi:GNAT family N-acetyltransferase [Sedimentitalea sp. HM32M-2]|uniref:GNAT family N-acetyltransferase n=1 Tax=Sedimentitalea sp. HM32M-2 TaxID=3351566 RepID=UPI0036D3C0BC